MLLSAERKKLVYAVRWVKRDVQTILILGFLLGQRETTKWNIDFDATTPPATNPFPRLVGRTSGYLHDHYTSHDVGKLKPLEESESQVVRCLCLCRIPLNPSYTDRPYNRCH